MKKYNGADLIPIAGIYSITNAVTKRAYIGQSKNILSRWVTHVSILQAGNHTSTMLQSNWTEYGPAFFDFEVLELVDKDEELIKAESREIKTRDRQGKKLYNFAATGENNHPKAR